MRKTNRKIEQRETPISDLFPQSGKDLLIGGGKQFVERIGVEAVRQAVYSVMLGENIRTQTEPISRMRIAQVSGAIIAMIAKGYLTVENFQKELSNLAIQELATAKRNDNEKVWPAQWLIGITGKSFQNVLRSNQDAIYDYIKDFENAIAASAQHCRTQYGDYTMSLSFNYEGINQNVQLDWEGMTRLTTAIGSQTLTLRGSDKSIYGKLFERLILGTILTMLGFKRVDRKYNKETENVFWLSDSSDNRESDATLIIRPGHVARFDIGFIGPGNSEISKDKLSRFARDIELSGENAQSVTFIIVDRLPTTGKTKAAADKIGAEIIQMSMAYWPKELAEKLRNRFGFEHEILNVNQADLNVYIKNKIANVQIQDFLNDVTIEEIEEDSSINLDIPELEFDEDDE